MRNIFTTIIACILCASMAQAQVFVTSNSNLGIGTLNPSAKLDIQGSTFIPYGNSYWIGSTVDAGSRLRLHHNGTDAYIDYSPNLHFRAGTNEVMYLNSIGTVGIGTSSPNLYYRFTVDGGNSLGGIALNVDLPDWYQSMITTVTRQNTVSYVVHLNGNNGGDKFYVFGNGMVYAGGQYLGSDSILKKNINPITKSVSLTKIRKLKGMNYDFKSDSDNVVPGNSKSLKSSSTGYKGRHFGFLAQDVEKVIPEIVATMHDGTKAVNYIEIIPFIIEAIKEQSATIDSLQTQIVTLNAQVIAAQNCCKGNTKMKDDIIDNSETGSSASGIQTISTAKLYQNAPNPFRESTTIKLEIPETVQNAMVCIYDLNGRQLKCLPVNGRGNTSVQVFGNELTAGLYHYALIADGALVDTKTMVLTN